MDDDARAAAVLTSSVLPQFAYEFMGLGTISEMWIRLRQRYQPSGDALYLSMVRQEHALQQGDSTVDEFYAQSSAIWRQLDSLRTAGCGGCQCCQAVRADLEFHRVYEFLSRLRKEFEPRRAQLFARGRVSLLEALSEIRAEETRLRGVGLLEVPSVLAARAPATPCASGGEGRPRARLHCGYCDKDGHPESDCFKKQRHMRNMEHSSSVTPSAVTFTEQDILKLKRLLAASGSPSIGSAGLVADSSLERPLSSHSDAQRGNSSWSWPSPP
jgi:hypothetical protein